VEIAVEIQVHSKTQTASCHQFQARERPIDRSLYSFEPPYRWAEFEYRYAAFILEYKRRDVRYYTAVSEARRNGLTVRTYHLPAIEHRKNMVVKYEANDIELPAQF
jgi:hypothetical protein